MELVAVTRENHQDKSWRAPAGYHFAKGTNIAAVFLSEAGIAAASMPLVVQKVGEAHALVALMGAQAGHNLMVAADGKWLGRYVPAVLRLYPFRLAKPAGKTEAVLCIHEIPGVLGDRDYGQPFFDAHGQLSTQLADVLKALGTLEAEGQATRNAVDALDRLGLLAPIDLQVRTPGSADAPKTGVSGLFRVDEKKLHALDATTFTSLRDSGVLALAYAQIMSMHQFAAIKDLAARFNREQAVAREQAQPQQAPGLVANDGVLKFS